VSAERRRRSRDSVNAAWIGAELFANGVAVRDGFLPPGRVRGLIRCAKLRRARGDFGEARIGVDRLLQRREGLRGDRTCWIAPLPQTPLFPAESALLADLERLRLDLNRLGLLGLFDLELHHAWYPPGSGYARHVDQLRDREQRVVSVVLYLNDDWRPEDGGELRIFDTATNLAMTVAAATDATGADGTATDAAAADDSTTVAAATDGAATDGTATDGAAANGTAANGTAANDAAANGAAARDIAPIGGRLVCFLTAGREHAVLRCRRDRASISGWFRRRSAGCVALT
jgi:Rps23 Pro-64 3,4-dihydroxylase Tpa1-like proline 4-hydroxylase